MLIVALFAEKLQAEKFQLQTTEIPKKPFAKVSVDLIVELPVLHSGNKKNSCDDGSPHRVAQLQQPFLKKKPLQ